MKAKTDFTYSPEQVNGFLQDLCNLAKSYKIRDVKKFLSEQILPIAKNRVRLGGYKVKIKFDKEQNPNIDVLPGMTVTLETKSGKQKIIEYFLEPFQKNLDNALKG